MKLSEAGDVAPPPAPKGDLASVFSKAMKGKVFEDKGDVSADKVVEVDEFAETEADEAKLENAAKKEAAQQREVQEKKAALLAAQQLGSQPATSSQTEEGKTTTTETNVGGGAAMTPDELAKITGRRGPIAGEPIDKPAGEDDKWE